MSSKDKAEELHRDALHSILYDFMNWLAKQRASCNQKVTHGRTCKDEQRKKEAAVHAIRAEVFSQAIEKLKELRKVHGEASARASVIGNQMAEQGAIKDPTPEQIAAKCEEIRASWSEKERASRHWQKCEPVDTEPTTFIF